MSYDLLFYSGIALLLTHELDAIYRHEWRIFPVIQKLKDEVAYHWFTILHVPLFILVLWLLCHPSENIRFWFQVGMDFFFIVHFILHQLVKSNKNYEFVNTFSKAIIYSIGVIGIVHISILVGLLKV